VRNARRWPAAIAVLGSLLFAGSQAIAANASTAAPSRALAGQSPVRARAVDDSPPAYPPLTGFYHICLTHSPTFCLKSNGTGNQVTITSHPADYATFSTVAHGTYRGAREWRIANALGNCLRGGANFVVKIEDGGCSSTDPDDSWLDGGSPNWLQNKNDYQTEALMKVVAAHEGNNVWHDAPCCNDWFRWSYPPTAG
jgi:hypothetical protein